MRALATLFVACCLMGAASKSADGVTHLDVRRAPATEAEPERRLPQLVWLHDSFEAGSRDFVVKGLLEPQSLAVLFGDPGSGKSTLAVDLAFAIATGTPWRGRPTEKGLVVHVAGEGARGLRLRQAAYVKHFDVPRTAPYGVLPTAVPFDAGADTTLVPLVLEAARDMGSPPRLVIVDTLARCLVGDENAGADMAGFIRACDYLRAATGAAVLVVHHQGKDAARGARGHSSLRAAADTEMQVEGASNPRTLHVRKQRDLELADPMAFELEPVTLSTEDDGTNITACVVKHSDQAPAPAKPSGKQQTALLAELERRYQRGEVAWTEAQLRAIGRDLEMHKNTARSAVVGLRAAGYLVDSVGGATLKHQPEARS